MQRKASAHGRAMGGGGGGMSVGSPPKSDKSAVREAPPMSLPPSRSGILCGVVVCAALLVVLTPVLMHFSTSHAGQLSAAKLRLQNSVRTGKLQVAVKPVEEDLALHELDHTPVVVLSTGEGKWNTGVWPGYGEPKPTLNWAAAGVVVDKSSCPYQCDFTHDQSKLGVADAVLMELVNHPKFLGSNTAYPVPWPAKRPKQSPSDPSLPLIGNFYMEPPTQYPKYTTDPALKEHVDFTVGPDRAASDIPITLVCPWGKPEAEFLKPPPAKAPGALLAYFNEHGVASPYSAYVAKLRGLLGDKFHSYQGGARLPAEAQGSLSNRLAFMSKYKFALVTEPLLLKDWVEPDWSHTLVAGVVPVYIGAPNIADYAPGRKSFIDIRDYPAPEDLVARLREMDSDPALYNSYFAWKQSGLSPQFKERLDQCVHYAECRICARVRKELVQADLKRGAAAEIASMS